MNDNLILFKNILITHSPGVFLLSFIMNTIIKSEEENSCIHIFHDPTL